MNNEQNDLQRIFLWIASQARNDDAHTPSLRGTKQSRNLICTWIASQARNDDAHTPRHCEERSNPET